MGQPVSEKTLRAAQGFSFIDPVDASGVRNLYLWPFEHEVC